MNEQRKTHWLRQGVLCIGTDAEQIIVDSREEREIPIFASQGRKQKRRILLIRKETIQIS